MSNLGLLEGETCNRNDCLGVMERIDTDSSCSCHIAPPCSHCVDACYICSECGFETEPPEPVSYSKTKNGGIPDEYQRKKTDRERFDEIPNGVFKYVTIPGTYYFMTYWGKFPEGWGRRDILEKFNTCFGYKWIKFPEDGEFKLKVYTD